MTGSSNLEFLAWLAGFWEGEGSLSIGPSVAPNYPRARLQIKQVNKEPLELIRSKLGGILRVESGKGWRLGKKPIWRWVVNKRLEVIRILRLVLPHLRFRKKDVEHKLRFLIGLEIKKKQSLFKVEKVLELNQRKIPITKACRMVGITHRNFYRRKPKVGELDDLLDMMAEYEISPRGVAIDWKA